jgi:hypothetical protein
MNTNCTSCDINDAFIGYSHQNGGGGGDVAAMVLMCDGLRKQRTAFDYLKFKRHSPVKTPKAFEEPR